MKDRYLALVEGLNKSPMFSEVAKKLNYKKVGISILNEGSVVGEYTSHNDNGRITKLEKGLNNPEFVAEIEEHVLEEITSEEAMAWAEANPIKAAMKYSSQIKIPLSVKLKLLSML